MQLIDGMHIAFVEYEENILLKGLNMPNLPAPVSTAHIQVINSASSSAPASSPKGVNGEAAETSGEAFGALLQSQIQGLAASLKRPLNSRVAGDEPDAGEAKLSQEGAATSAENVAVLFAPFTPVVATPVQTDIQVTSADISRSSGRATGKLLDKDVLQNAIGADVKQAGKDGAAEIAGTGKFSQAVDLAKLTNTPDFDSKALTRESANTDQVMRTDGYSSVAASQATQSTQMPSAVVEPKVGAPGWDTALGQKLTLVANQAHQVAELHLNPPNLGPLEVRLTVNNDQATAMFVSNHAAVREAIESALPRLREMLADNGLTLGNVTVGSQSFSQQQQTFNGNDNQQNRQRGSQPILPGDIASVPDSGRVIARSWNNGMVDTFA